LAIKADGIPPSSSLPDVPLVLGQPEEWKLFIATKSIMNFKPLPLYLILAQ
jgi:hypothetical protein